MPKGKLANPVLFICDLQDRFRAAIHKFPQCVTTTQKLVKACNAMSIPIYMTTQNRARLGDTVPELSDAVAAAAGNYDKTKFSMVIPELERAAALVNGDGGGAGRKEIAIVGIESHVCVLMTVLDLLRLGHKVYVVADGVSSCNKQEVPVALARMRSEGAIITTSESWIFEVMGDASTEEFRTVSAIIKETRGSTMEALQSLL